MADLRDNWRIVLLVVMLALSAIVLFVPSATIGDGVRDGPTNLQYGLELDGGTRISAPITGMSVEQVAVERPRDEVVRNLSARLGVESIDVAVRDCRSSEIECRNQDGYVVEVFNDSVTVEEFVAALGAESIERINDNGPVTADHVRNDPSPETYNRMASAINSKLDATGLSGGSATTASSADGQRYIVVEAPNREPEDLVNLLDERGIVELAVRYPGANDTMIEETLVTAEGIRTVDPPRQGQSQQNWRVPVKLTPEGGDRFQNVLNRVNFTDLDTTNYRSCPSEASRTNSRNTEGYCLLTVVNDEVKGAFTMDGDLARTIAEGRFDDDPRFFFTAGNQSDAQRIQTNIEAGALPAPLALEERQTFTLEGALAEQFKVNALVTAIFAVLAVSFSVYIRYQNVTVAAPMVVTALSEVVLLLGFASIVGLPLDLSHIAGFIAVIGTGVDDLVIIADEVMAEQVNSRRVFQSRFRKAFWVIGAAAATTIIAMSPLAILSLGDLRGFAIITILGVLIGVLVTRPAYGDILRSLVTGDK